MTWENTTRAWHRQLYVRRLARTTIEAYLRTIRAFARSMPEAWLYGPAQVDEEMISSWIVLRSRAISPRSQAQIVAVLRAFFRWMVTSGRRRTDPTRYLQSPKTTRLLPRPVSETDVKSLLSTPSRRDPRGIRDAAFLELLYSSGLRVSEALAATTDNLDLVSGRVRVRGKGGKEREVPVGTKAIEALGRWLAVRTRWAKTDRAIFIGAHGRRLTRQWGHKTVKFYADLAGIDGMTPHRLRHSFATHLLDHGAPIEAIQRYLGHADINTTAIYTEVSTKRLEEIYYKHHPRG